MPATRGSAAFGGGVQLKQADIAAACVGVMQRHLMVGTGAAGAGRHECTLPGQVVTGYPAAWSGSRWGRGG